ncbi:MAG: 4Fe-4S binding protein [Deltaproteobacteria bacterium]|nr:4Fe-4S binding protein [Deltaproteobacteria bacterium]
MSTLSLHDRIFVPDYSDPGEVAAGLLAFDPEKCSRCGTCTRICPARSIRFGKKQGKQKPLPELMDLLPGISACVACGDCLAACPEDAISITRGFRASGYYQKITQKPEMTFPKRY